MPQFAQSGGALDLVIDSTGLKILCDGEWQAHKHKTSNKRRSWRKLHLGIDGDGYIITSALTDRTDDDGCVAISMLEKIKGSITRFTADGAYDSRPMYEALATAGDTDIKVVIPPMKTAAVDTRATGVFVPTQSGYREDPQGWSTTVAKGVRCSPAGSSRERDVPVQMHYWG